jgi:hypothetical protein
MPSPEFCGAWGFAISFLVEFLKKLPWVKSNPQWAALIASALLQVLLHVPGTPPYAVPIREIALCVLQTWVTAIATHEVVTQSVQKRG